MTENKLLPCPFCPATVEHSPPGNIYLHPQNGCILSGKVVTKEQWNTRTTVTPSDKAAADLYQLTSIAKVNAPNGHTKALCDALSETIRAALQTDDDLVKALEDIYNYKDDPAADHHMRIIAREAIAKHRGKK